MHTLDDLLAAGVAGRTVLVRSDLNVPLDGSTITDDGRIKASLPTMQALILGGAKVVVTAHLGRPKGAPESKYSLAPGGRPARRAARRHRPAGRGSGRAVRRGRPSPALARRRGGDAGERPVRRPGDLEGRRRTRPHWPTIWWRVVGDGAAFVSDGFGVVHRKQASVYEIAQKLPHFAGYLVSAETAVLKKLTVDPERPYAVILGGSKVSDKLGRDHLAAAPGGFAADRRRHGLHLPGRTGSRRRRLAAAGGPDRDLQEAAGGERRQDRAAHGCGDRGRVLGRRRGADRRRRRHPGRLAGSGHRAGERREVRRSRCGRDDRVLERADGRLRTRTVRGRHPRRSPRPSPPRRRSPWSAAAIPPLPCAFSASTNPDSPTSRPAVAHPWSTSRAKSSPAWPYWRH